MSKQEQKQLEILESVGQAAKAFTLSENPVRDEHDIFSELMAKKMRKLEEVLSEDEMEDSEAKTNSKKRNTNNPPVNITNLLTSPKSQNGYIQYLQALAQHPTLRGYSHIQSTSQEPCSFLQSLSFNYNAREVISDIDTEEQK